MIKNEISKRILTSIVLLPIVIFTILSKTIYFNILIGVIYILSLREWYNISKKYFLVLFLGFFIITLSIFSAYTLRGNIIDTKILFLWIYFSNHRYIIVYLFFIIFFVYFLHSPIISHIIVFKFSNPSLGILSFYDKF